MRVARGRTLGDPALPAIIAAKYRDLAETYASVAEASPWPAKAERIEAGSPVEISSWEIPHDLAPEGPRVSGERFTLNPDGRLILADGR